MDVLTAVDGDRIASDLKAGHKFWLDLVDAPDEEIDRVGDLLGLHPIAVEDTREFGQRPKVDVYSDHVLLVFFTARLDDNGSVQPIEVHVYVAGEYLITARRGRCDILDDLRDRVEAIHEHPVYEILDTLTDAFYPVIEGLEERVDALEADVLTRPRREQLTAIYRLLQEVRMIGRTASVQRDQFEAASDDVGRLVDLEDTGEYLRDIGDHLAQIAGELHRQSEDLSTLTSTYFNANADRLNAVATRLTIIGTLFVLWTLVTGFFGQNFGWLVDHVESRNDFLIFGVGSLVLPTVILLTVFWVKRRDWF
ncbi:MAG TPA: magnesium transporter CorA family protein [Solirubrobacteraceae bacterium]|nr:magnesium transporter CorA family protein [Solirubrobacteraceae bacterium]